MVIYSLLPAVLNMSMTAGIVIIFVILFRFFLKKAPKIFSYLLWGVVLFRLLCPFSVSSPFSLLRIVEAPVSEKGNMEYIPVEMVKDDNSTLITPSNAETAMGKEDGDESGKINPPGEAKTGNPFRQTVMTFTWIWLLGIAVTLIYSFNSLFILKRKLVGKVCLEDNIYQSDYITSPFVMGVIKPCIYLPSSLSEREREYIILHEKTHIRRGDPCFRLLAYAALVIHWFNPLVWLAFRLSGKDMEMSCDEAVMKRMKEDIRAEYSSSLLSLATGAQRIAATPLAFGEGDVKSRIKNVLHYRKPSRWIIIVSVVMILVVGISLMVNPVNERENILEAKTTENKEISAQQVKQNENSEMMENSFENVAEKEKIITDLKRWADAFCERDGKTIYAMSSEELRASLEEQGMMTEGGADFGWSSPWPWDKERDYRIVNVTDTEAEILYYAWVSDPHVTVWKENLKYRVENGKFIVEEDNSRFLTYLCVAEEFYEAYPDGVINDTPMDYLRNDVGEALNENAKQNRESEFYAKLFEPETAAGYLLNLLDNENKVKASSQIQQDGSVKVTFRFTENESYAYVIMIQPYGEDGIWIPQTWKE